MRIIHNNILNILKLVSFGLFVGGLSSCSDNQIEELEGSSLESKSQIVLSFTMTNEGASTRADDDPEGYESGIDYENYIDIVNGDFKIYFFTYDESGENDEKGGTLIAQFAPTRITSSSTSQSTTYTMSGALPEELKEVSDFRVVMLANWGSYPSTVTGTTTIDDLCEGEYTTFSASEKFTIDEDHHIPFYGVQEFSGVKINEGETTTLSTPISLLRALAKVEVIMLENSYIDTFGDVSIVNYNSQGYCAPWQVYSSKDYHADDYSNIGPDDDDWSSVFTGLHLVGGANDSNDSETKTQSFTRVSDATQDTWYIYVPEYDNITNAGTQNDDYSYIEITVGSETKKIHFANYEDGSTNAYNADATDEDKAKRIDIRRNNLYRFYVIINEASEESVSVTVRVYVNKWETLQSETFEF